MRRIGNFLARATRTAGLRAAVTAALAVAMLAPAAGRTETLADAMAGAYEHSGLLEQNRALLRAADENVAQAVAALRPIISWTGNLTHTRTRGASQPLFISRTSSGTSASIGLTAQLVLYDFGQTSLGVDVAKETVLRTRQSLIAIEQNVLLRAALAYLEVRRASEFLGLRQNNLRLITQELQAARDRFEVGEVTRTDVSLAEARLAAARSGLASAQGTLEQARQEYLVAVGRLPGNLQPPTRLPALPPSVEAAQTIALRGHPEILGAQREVTIAELNVALADAALKPTIDLTGRAGVEQNFNSDAYSKSVSIGVGVSGPVYAGGRLSSLQRQAMQQRDAQRAVLHVVSHDIRQAVANAYTGVLVARASSAAGEEGVRAARVAFRGVREETTLGARTTLDVLNAEQELLQASADLISAQIDEYASAYRLLAAMGRLTAVDLRLRVTIYDPTDYYNMVKSTPAGISEQGQRLDRVLRRIGKE